MSSSSPIIPPDSPLRRSLPADNRKLFLTVSAIIALHVCLLAGLLIQGCKRQDSVSPSQQSTDMSSDLGPLTNTPGNEQAAAPIEPSTSAAPQTGTSVTEAPMAAPQPTPLPPAPPETAPHSATSPTVNNPPESVTPPTSTPVPAPAMGNTVVYQVKRGDTLTSIARTHHTTPKAIRTANNLKTDRILVGQKLKVPEGQAGTNAQGGTPAPTASTPR